MHLKALFLSFFIIARETFALPVNELGPNQPVESISPSYVVETHKKKRIEVLQNFGKDTGKVLEGRKDISAEQKKKDETINKFATGFKSAVQSNAKHKQAAKELEYICDGQMNQENWKKINMDGHLKRLAKLYPKNPFPNNAEVEKGASFIRYLAQISEKGNFDCSAQSCKISVDEPNCKNYPIEYFALFAFNNLQAWGEDMSSAMDTEHSWAQGNVGKIVGDFTDHDIDTGVNNGGFIIAAGILGILGAIGGAGGLAIASVAGGLVASAGTLAASADNGLDMLQNEFDSNAELGSSLAEIYSKLKKGVISMTRDVLNDEPNEGNAIKVLSGGNFASPPDDFDYDKASEKAHQFFKSTAINAAWYKEQIFIVKADSISGDDACDCVLDGGDDNNWGDARVCVDGTAYIFVKTNEIDNLSGTGGKWPNPSGLSKLKDFDLSLEKMAKAAVWFQDEFGGFGTTESYPSANDMKKYVTGDKKGPPDGLWVSLPVIDYEKTPSISYNSMDYFGSWNHHFHRLINNCRLYIRDLDGWPYDSLEPE